MTLPALTATRQRIGIRVFWTLALLGLAWSVCRNLMVLDQRWSGATGAGLITLDFDVFTQAAKMFARGESQCLYDRACLQTAQKAAGFNGGLMSWNYPPVIALALAPFAEIPERAWYFGLMAFNAALAAALGWRIAGRRGACLALAYEPVLATLILGQTSLITAALLVTGVTAIAARPARPGWGGAALGLLAIKPHLAWTAPLVVLAQRKPGDRMRSLAGGALSAGLLVAASLVWPGPEAWRSFFLGLSQAGQALTAHKFPWQQMPSLFVTLAALGLPTGYALAGQILGVVMAGAGIVHAWRKAPPEVAAALTLIGTALGSPYLYRYDLVCVGFGAALYLRHRSWTWRRGAIAYLTLIIPLIGIVQNDVGAVLGDNHWTILPMGPMLLALFVMVWRDAASEETRRVQPDTAPARVPENRDAVRA